MADENYNKLLANYFLNAVRAWKTNPKRILSMARVADTYSGEFGLKYSFPQEAVRKIKGKGAKAVFEDKKTLTKSDIDKLEKYFIRAAAKFKKADPTPEYEFLDGYLKHLEFSKTDRDIAKLVYFAMANPFALFFRDMSSVDTYPGSLDTITAFLGRQKKDVVADLKMNSPLMNSGIIYMQPRDYEGEPVRDRLVYHVHPRLIEAMDNEEFNIQAATERLIGKSIVAKTEWEDFQHIKDEAEYAARIVRGALKMGSKGINILVYGDTGTGKTAFCQTLAAYLKSPLYATGEKPDDDDSHFDNDGFRREQSTAAARLADKRLVEKMLSRRGGSSLIMFDEMEDVLSAQPVQTAKGSRSGFQLGKAATNNLLTENEIPCLWATNAIERFDPALLRRFSFSIELKTPTADIRKRVMKRTLAQYQRELTGREIDALAADHALPPALYNKAVESASLASNEGDANFLDNLRMGLKASARMVTGSGGVESPKPVKNYDLTLVNANQDLADLSDKILRGGHRNFSICAFGVSGAGKSEFMVHLADRMGLESLLVPYSDVGSAYVSETEKSIRQKFEQAADERKFLIFDEADSLLYDRRNATHTWERHVVNEMLNRMSRHKYPMACTTNLMEEMDQASLRRFIFKIRFDGLKPEQARTAYHNFFEHPAPADAKFSNLIAPGDFANVLQQAEILGTKHDPQWLLPALQRECAMKRAANRPIGFVWSEERDAPRS